MSSNTPDQDEKLIITIAIPAKLVKASLEWFLICLINLPISSLIALWITPSPINLDRIKAPEFNLEREVGKDGN